MLIAVVMVYVLLILCRGGGRSWILDREKRVVAGSCELRKNELK